MARLTISLGLILIFIFLFSSVGFPQAGERLVLTTYYPAPFGVYREMQILGTDGEEIVLREDDNQNASIILTDTGAVRNPYIGWERGLPPVGGMPDCYIQIQNSQTLQLVCGIGPLHRGPLDPPGSPSIGPGRFRFLSRNPLGNLVPGTIEAGEILICN